jgi:hypothetical protein
MSSPAARTGPSVSPLQQCEPHQQPYAAGWPLQTSGIAPATCTCNKQHVCHTCVQPQPLGLIIQDPGQQQAHLFSQCAGSRRCTLTRCADASCSARCCLAAAASSRLASIRSLSSFPDSSSYTHSAHKQPSQHRQYTSRPCTLCDTRSQHWQSPVNCGMSAKPINGAHRGCASACTLTCCTLSV